MINILQFYNCSFFVYLRRILSIKSLYYFCKITICKYLLFQYKTRQLEDIIGWAYKDTDS